MLAGASLYLDNPLLVEWHNAGPIFSDPIQATVGWVTLLHQLGFSVQRPRKRLARADAEAQAQWLREKLPAIKKKPRPAAAY